MRWAIEWIEGRGGGGEGSRRSMRCTLDNAACDCRARLAGEYDDDDDDGGGGGAVVEGSPDATAAAHAAAHRNA